MSKKEQMILDFHCGGGGAAMGYHREGFDILGIDHKKKRNYPFPQIKVDIPTFIRETPIEWFQEFDLIHTSPPCQKYTRAAKLAPSQGNKVSEIDHIQLMREFLIRTEVPYVIENVEGAPLNGVKICGSSFALRVRRHRIFEANFPIKSLKCQHQEQGKPVGIYGSMGDTVQGTCSKTGAYVIGGSTAKDIEEAQNAMGIDWLGWSDLKESVPPFYTQHIAKCFKKWRANINDH